MSVNGAAAVAERPQELEDNLPEDTGVRPYRWTVDELFRAVELGAFDNPERLELLDGEVIERMTHNPPHFYSMRAAAHHIPATLPQPCEVRQQGRWQLSDVDYVEPDLVFAKGTYEDYQDRDPRVDEVLLVVEVSDTTLRQDRGRKAAKYARMGVLDYWIINLASRHVEVYREPAVQPDSQWGYGFTSVAIYGEGESVASLAAPDATVRVADLLPRPEI